MSILRKNGFETREQVSAFFTIVFSGQLVYSAFESLKIPFYDKLIDYYGLTDTQFGLLFTMLGVAMFFYIPGGWVNNRFNVRVVLISGLVYRLFSSLFIILVRPSFSILMFVTFTWGVLDAIFWPAVVKGVALYSGRANKGVGLGTLAALRAGGEAVLNGILIGILTLAGGSMLVFKGGMIVYALLTIPMIVFIYRFVPGDPRVEGHVPDYDDAVQVSAKQAFFALVATLKIARVWSAGICGMCVYWVYMTIFYTEPFLTRAYGMSEANASWFSVLSTIIFGVSGGIIGGLISDKIVKSAAKTLLIVSLSATAIMVYLAVLPKNPTWLVGAIVGIVALTFVVIMGTGIQQAPVAELHLPSYQVGSAMAVNSFLGFACILWAMTINGRILDAHESEPGAAFTQIFVLMAVVSAVGALAAGLLVWMNKRVAAAQELELGNELISELVS
ncbi:MFS transporter [Arcanobacterium bovis]|uniref:MFS transporter n=1 Tax=Arcanobacterium bovis TaxID=2529275 RepID=A0A4Q9UYS2_9ACTO|nr:MFS transporter [Arcanobacterium bovis]TBW20848.1 MFS transporter [Arcanobacterium bovis]